MDQQVSLLKIETDQEHSELKMPSFVKVIKEVTQDDNYASGSIAKIGWKMPDKDKKAILNAVNSGK